jgi:hypothetical protein
MKLLGLPDSRNRSKRRRIRWLRTVSAVVAACFALAGLVLTYLLDFRRLGRDAGLWLRQMDQAHRRGDGE